MLLAFDSLLGRQAVEVFHRRTSSGQRPQVAKAKPTLRNACEEAFEILLLNGIERLPVDGFNAC